MHQLAAVAEQFVGPNAEVFPTSPLYRALRPVVAQESMILEMLTHRRPGQQSTYLFFGAVHHLLLGGVDHPLRDFYPSIVGEPECSLATASTCVPRWPKATCW